VRSSDFQRTGESLARPNDTRERPRRPCDSTASGSVTRAQTGAIVTATLERVLALQRSAGNQAVARLIAERPASARARPGLQRKLKLVVGANEYDIASVDQLKQFGVRDSSFFESRSTNSWKEDKVPHTSRPAKQKWVAALYDDLTKMLSGRLRNTRGVDVEGSGNGEQEGQRLTHRADTRRQGVPRNTRPPLSVPRSLRELAARGERIGDGWAWAERWSGGSSAAGPSARRVW
jgi:hypothetical protein